jgi:CBS domain-containing protein
MFGKQSLYLVFGGNLETIGRSEFQDLQDIELVGLYGSFNDAEAKWRSKSQANVDNAARCYRVVALHNIISPADSVSDFLSTHNVSTGLRVSPETTVSSTCRKMADANVGAAIIVEDDKPIGVFSERDLIGIVAEAEHGWRDEPISKYMTPSPLCVSMDDKLVNALSVMNDHHFRHLPVISQDGMLRHVISVRDFAFARNENFINMDKR